MQLPKFPTIHRKAYQKKWDKTQWGIVIDHLYKMKSKGELEKFLATFLPKKNRLALIQRIITQKRLQEGYKHREISAELGISVQTVSSVKNAAEKGKYESYKDRFADSIAKRREKALKYLDKKTSKPVKPRYKKTKYGKVRFPN